LKAATDRLRLVATFRPEFPRLAQHRKTDLSLFRFFKTAVVLPPREAGPYKERCLQHLASSDTLKTCQKMVHMMRKEFPSLYQLESDFLGQVLKLKARRQSVEYAIASDGEGWGIPAWLIGVVVLVVIRALMAAMR
jgi:hypothetical protein